MEELQECIINLFESLSENVKMRIEREFIREDIIIENFQTQKYKNSKIKQFKKELLKINPMIFEGIRDPLLEIEKTLFSYLSEKDFDSSIKKNTKIL